MANPIVKDPPLKARDDGDIIAVKRTQQSNNKRIQHLDLARLPLHQQRLSRFIQDSKKIQEHRQAVNRPAIAGRAYVVSDVTSITAKVASAVGMICGTSQGDVESSMLSCSSMINIGTGAMTLLYATDQYKTAVKTGNTILQKLSAVQTVTGSAETVYGFSATGKNLIDALGYDGLVSTSKASFTAASILGHVGTAGGAIRYGAHFCSALYQFYNAATTYRRLTLAKTDEEAFTYLKQELELTQEDYNEALKKYTRVKEPISFEDLKWVRPEDVAFVSKQMLEEKKRLQLLKEIIHRRMGKEKALSIKISPSIVSSLKTFKEGDDKALIVKEAKKESFWKALTQIAFAFLCIVGITSTVLADIFSGGVFKVVLFAIGSYISLHWLYLDTKMLNGSMQSHSPGKYDTLFKWVINLLILAVSAAAIVYTGGLPLILIGIACSIVLLSANCAIWYKSEMARRKKEEERLLEQRSEVSFMHLESLFVRDDITSHQLRARNPLY